MQKIKETEDFQTTDDQQAPRRCRLGFGRQRQLGRKWKVFLCRETPGTKNHNSWKK